MKTTYFILSLLITILFITSPNYAQQEERNQQPQLTRDQSLFPLQSTGIWTEVHPLIPRVDYWGVHFINADTGWAVGEGGAIIKTTNGGEKWIWYESGVENTLRTVASVNNGQRVIAAGDGGIILISEDAGEMWNPLPSGTTDNIWNMQMITNEIGWMVGEGGTALKTMDGGLTWNQQPMPYPTISYWDVSFIDTSFGYICCNTGIVLKTTNGGSSWQIQQTGDTRSLFTIYAFDSLWASAAGFAGKVVYTTNGGSNWINVAGVSAPEINKIKFVNDTTGFMACSGFYQSTDRGMSWFYRNDFTVSGTAPLTTNISFPNGSTGYFVGGGMLLAKTIDEGESWNRMIVNTDFLNAYFKDEQNGFLNSSQLIYTTNDGGYTLDTLETFPYTPVDDFNGMMFIDSLTGFAGYGTIYKTTDGGLNWYATNGAGGRVRRFFFIDSIMGWAISPSTIYKTIDGGENWFQQFYHQYYSFTGIFFIDSMVGWTTILSRRPFKTSDGGDNWIEQTSLNFYSTTDVYFSDDSVGLIIENDKLYKTFDRGNNWILDSSVAGLWQGRFDYFDSDNIFITGTKVYRTTNAGTDWIEFPELEGQGYREAITLLSVNSGYFVASIGLIVKYYDESVPVELINFQGLSEENETHLQWTTATETNNRGFYIQRKRLGGIKWTEISFIEGKGNSTEINNYFYKDILRESGAYFYRLKQTDFNGAYEYSKEIEINFSVPSTFKIMPNFPNPFNPTTNIRIVLPDESFITVELYNLLGELVRTIINKEFQAGIFDVKMNLSELSSGVYLYKVIAKTKTGIIYSKSDKMILSK